MQATRFSVVRWFTLAFVYAFSLGVAHAGQGLVAKATDVSFILTVSKSGSGSGTVASSAGLINCGGICSDSYENNTLVTLSSTPAIGSQFTGWLGACTGLDPCAITVTGATAVSATFAPSAPGVPSFDIDGNGASDALTDGLLIIRYLFGLTGGSLVNNAIGAGASRMTDAQVSGYLNDIKPALDVDGNGQADALSDGLLIIRYLFGLRGSTLTAGAVGPGAAYLTATDIGNQIAIRIGSCLDGGVARTIVRPVAGDLVINEVLPGPAAVADTVGEWFEVLVKRDVDLNAVGFERATGSAGPTFITTTNCVRATTGSLLVFARSAETAANGGLPAVTATFSFALPAGPGDLRLVERSTVLDVVTWTGSTSGKSIQLDPDSATAAANDDPANWCNATTPYGGGDLGTPGSANPQCTVIIPPGMCDAGGTIRTIVSPAAGQLVITEFLADPAGNEDLTREWFEITNVGGASFDLNGLELTRAGMIGDVISSAACKPVLPGGYALFARSADPAINGGLPAVDALITFSLSNSNGNIEVRDGQTILDAITWSSVVSGISRQLDPDSLTVAGNDNLANFCNSTGAYGTESNLGTPKLPNVQCP